MYINEERVGNFLAHVGQNYQSASPGEMIAFALILLGVIAGLMTTGRLRARRRRAREIERSRRIFEEEAVRVGLSPSERALLEEVSLGLDDPDAERHLLFSRRDLFFRCTELVRQTEGRELELQLLKVRLNLNERSEGQLLRGSTELPPGALLTHLDGRPACQVLRVHAGGVRALLHDPGLEVGPVYEFEFRRREGVYRASFSLYKREGAEAELQHTAQLKREEQRQSYREPVSLAARLDGRFCDAVDLGGGGAALELNPAGLERGRLYKLELLLPTPGDRTERIECQVRLVALREDVARVHAAFVRIREGDRDRIYQYLFRLRSAAERRAGDEGPGSPESRSP